VAASFYSNLFSAHQSHNLDPFIHQINTYVEELPSSDLQPTLDTKDEDISLEEVAHTLKKHPTSPPAYRLPKFQNLLAAFFHHGTSRLYINSRLSFPFKVSQGVCQGNPLSGPLAMEPLLCITGLTFSDIPTLLDILCRWPDHHPCQSCLPRNSPPALRSLKDYHRPRDKSKLILAQEATSPSFFGFPIATKEEPHIILQSIPRDSSPHST
jgi:hypothetical protein